MPPSTKIDIGFADSDSYRPYIGQRFIADVAGAEMSFVLENIKIFEGSDIRDSQVIVEGRELPPRKAFALTFVGPAEPVLPQGVYPMRHAEIGEFALFLSPFRRDRDGILYESVFN